MPEVLPSRARPVRSYAAIALFLAVYAGVLILVLAPREMIAVQSGVAVYGTDN
jgi:hypothetical protein